jgi:Ulp1 family protease
MEKINHGHCIDSDDLGFIELCKLSSHEEINGIEKDLFIAKATNISSILEQLRILTIDRNDFCFNEITDPYEIQTIMSADIANKLQLEENNPKKRKSRRSSAVSFAENPEDTEIYIVYPIETDASDPINITKGCMKRLNEGEYLNDNLIDYKIKVLLEQLKVTNEYKREKIHAFSCQFYIKLTEKRNPKEMFEMVARWTKDIDIFELDFLFVPVNIGSHWSLSVIVRPGLILQKNSKELTISSGGSFEEIEDNLPCIMFMDSLNLHNMTTISKQLRSYVEFEYNVKKLKIDISSINLNKRNFGASNSQQDNSQLVLNAENFPVIKCAVPQQPNGTDCGVYVIRFFQLIINQWPKSGKAQQDDKMKEFIRRNSFDHDEIVNMRLNIKEEIKSLKGIIITTTTIIIIITIVLLLSKMNSIRIDDYLRK